LARRAAQAVAPEPFLTSADDAAGGAGRAAVLVIHGIGSQPPLATLGTVAQGLLRRARANGDAVEAEAVLVESNGRSHSAVRFTGAGTPGAFTEVDVFEFAWQGLVQGRIRAVQVLVWLLATGLAPLDLRRHWRVLRDAGEDAPGPAAVVLRQAGIAAGLLLLVVALLATLAAAVSALPRAWPVVREAAASASVALAWADLAPLALSAVAATLTLLLVKAAVLDLWSSARRRRDHARDGLDWGGSYADAVLPWARAAAVAAVSSAAVAAALLAWSAPAWAALVPVVLDALRAPGVAVGAAAAAALVLLARLLVRVVGDIALYVTSDTSSPFHRSRAEIKRAGEDLLVGLLSLGEDLEAGAEHGATGAGGRDRHGALVPYDAVVLVGHSLGSVIAFDLVNVLSRRARSEGPPPTRVRPLLKLRGLLTFGSPLDKVAYFFRERLDDGASVHAQLLSHRHATKRRASRRDDGPYRLAPYRVPFGWLRWVHLYAYADPISNPLVFYDVDERRARPYRAPWNAHGRYWHDPATYQALDDLLRAARR
jgi:hypothetical protein